MKSMLILLTLALFAGCNNARDNAPAQSAAPAAAAPAAPSSAGANDAKWMVTEGVETPESIYIDPTGDIFSSQIAGMADQKDGNGHIIRMDKSGKVISATWVTGLNAPK